MPAFFLLLFRFGRALWSGLRDPEFRSLFLLVVIVIFSGGWFYHVQEGWSWLDSIYFTIITLTTVGYGDFSPQTAGGKIFTMIYILLGLGIISSFILLIAERHQGESGGLLQRLTRKQETRAE